MKQAFVIMQIGNSALDKVCKEAIIPALTSCKLDPKRVDKHNKGGLLKSEIINFIASADIIVADLTNERPNCYLEVGYTMGLDKFSNLILTAHENHNPDSPNHKSGGPKVHFDLTGYDILYWDPSNLKGFKEELEKRVKRRLAIIKPTTSNSPSPWDQKWLSQHRDKAFSGLRKSSKTGFMELSMVLHDFNLNVAQGELLRIARQSQIHTFGWPIGVVLNDTQYGPKPTTDGIFAEIADTPNNETYDYWSIRKDGSFYLLKVLFEDQSKPDRIFFNTRIVRITEVLLYAARLYRGLKVPLESHISIVIRHGGLKERILKASGSREIHRVYKSTEDQVATEIETSLERIEPDLVDLVQKFTQPLFVIFDFFELDRGILEDIVNNYVAGKAT